MLDAMYLASWFKNTIVNIAYNCVKKSAQVSHVGNKRFELLKASSYWVYSSTHITNYGSFL